MSKWISQTEVFSNKYFEKTVAMLCSIYPLLNHKVIGHSWCGRKIHALGLGSMESPVLYTAATHGNEWLSGLVLLRFCEELCLSARNETPLNSIDVKQMLATRGAVFVPCVNPDGVEICINGAASAGEYAPLVERLAHGDYSTWSANARGVDINHNFDAGWELLREREKAKGINAPAHKQYGGIMPESEAETYALTRLCRQMNFSTMFSLHSQGEEIYWRYGDSQPPRSELMAKVLAAVSTYTLCDPTDLASHGGFKDWFIKTFNKAAFTIELGKGQNPLPLSDFDSIYSTVCEMLLLGMLF